VHGVNAHEIVCLLASKQTITKQSNIKQTNNKQPSSLFDVLSASKQPGSINNQPATNQPAAAERRGGLPEPEILFRAEGGQGDFARAWAGRSPSHI